MSIDPILNEMNMIIKYISNVVFPIHRTLQLSAFNYFVCLQIF